MEIDSILIAKYLEGLASAEEAMAIENWRMQSVENKKQFEQYQQLWQSTSGLTYLAPSKEGLWNNIRSGIEQPTATALPKYFAFPIWKLVACVVLVLGIGFGIYSITTKKIDAAHGEQLITKSKSLEKNLLPDGTRCILTSGSSVSYPAKFKPEARLITMNGEAYFDVAKNGQPFVISVGDITVKVLGTSFSINTKNPDTTEVQLQTGKLMMYHGQDSLYLEAGQKGLYFNKEQRFARENDIDLNGLAFATKSFYFKDLPLSCIAFYLEKAYGVNIHFKKQAVKNCRMTSQFDGQELSYILDVVSYTLNVNYTISKDSIFIDGDGCN